MPGPSNPDLLWLGLILGAVVMIAQAWPKILGPLGDGIREWAKSKRTAEADADDADIKQLNRQVENLSRMLEQARDASRAERDEAQRLLAEEKTAVAEYRRLVGELYRWILAAQMDPKNVQRPVPEPYSPPTR